MAQEKPYAAAQSAIEIREASKVFRSGGEAVRALDRVSLSINQNEFFTLLGPSGCGKTTLLRLIGGFEQPSGGDILLEGRSLAGLPPFRRPINTVFQSYALFPHLSVEKNLAFGLEMLGHSRADIARRVEEMLVLVKLEGYGNRKVAELSGGQQQRIALARALAPQPKVLLLDEPLSALDLKLRKEMQIELKRLQTETGITFLFVTHDQQEALTMSDRLAVMDHGKVLQVGSPRDIYEHPTHRFVADFIGETNFLEGELLREGGASHLRLPCGARLEVTAADDRRGAVTAAVRPERAELRPFAAEGQGLPAEVAAVVYFGTDTVFYLRLGGGSPFTVRMQNREGAEPGFSVGQRVSVAVPPTALQILKD